MKYNFSIKLKLSQYYGDAYSISVVFLERHTIERWRNYLNISESFGYIINSIAKKIKKKLETKIRTYDITTAQWAVIKILSEENNLTQAEIA